METATVQAIKERNVRSGEGKRGAWSMDRVILDNGEEVNIFSPIEVGDAVESYQNGDYINWRLKDGAQSGTSSGKHYGPTPVQSGITTDQIYAEVIAQGKLLKEMIDRLKALMGEPVETPAVQAEQEDKRVKKAVEKQPDVVVDEVPDEPINLDDIPF